MTLTDEQKQQVAAWLAEGAKPADLQTRLDTEFGIRATYMEVRFLIDDLKLVPKDPAPPEAPKAAAEPGQDAPLEDSPADEAGLVEEAVLGGGVTVKVDEIMRPGAMVSGSVVFSDGKKASWYLDQYGRLGLDAGEPGYRPPQEDIVQFQTALDKELRKMGM
jgi:hypothetical protein